MFKKMKDARGGFFTVPGAGKAGGCENVNVVECAKKLNETDKETILRKRRADVVKWKRNTIEKLVGNHGGVPCGKRFVFPLNYKY